MKTRKAFAVILALVMICASLAVTASAATPPTIISGPIVTAYTDAQYFNPTGLVIEDEGTPVAYIPGDEDFRFIPALDELLTVTESGTVEVRVVYQNVECDTTITVTVSHVLGELEGIQNGHGQYCLGCGKLHNFESHTVSNWVPNDDAGFFTLQTQTGTCDVCGMEVTENIPNSNSFMSIFDFENMAEFEGTIVAYFYKIVVSLIQTLTSIS